MHDKVAGVVGPGVILAGGRPTDLLWAPATTKKYSIAVPRLGISWSWGANTRLPATCIRLRKRAGGATCDMARAVAAAHGWDYNSHAEFNQVVRKAAQSVGTPRIRTLGRVANELHGNFYPRKRLLDSEAIGEDLNEIAGLLELLGPLALDAAHDRTYRQVMLTKRIIPCLDVDAGRVVKGTSFVNIRDAGEPAELAALYNREGGDELVFLDITASSDSRNTMVEVIERVSEQVFIPLTVGGGIRSVDDVRRMLRGRGRQGFYEYRRRE